jgi:hypothetical protein
MATILRTRKNRDNEKSAAISIADNDHWRGEICNRDPSRISLSAGFILSHNAGIQTNRLGVFQ